MRCSRGLLLNLGIRKGHQPDFLLAFDPDPAPAFLFQSSSRSHDLDLIIPFLANSFVLSASGSKLKRALVFKSSFGESGALRWTTGSRAVFGGRGKTEALVGRAWRVRWRAERLYRSRLCMQIGFPHVGRRRFPELRGLAEHAQLQPFYSLA